ncbi:MAG: invasion associated locus B family protein [Alphaproteobacteria bacterium]|nr:invasion associated locus B family protein [Alphaproteobacteria bacterium]
MRKSPMLVLSMVVSLAGPAAAATDSLGTFGDWQAYAYAEKGGKVCYAASSPKAAGKRKAFLTVTHRLSDKTRDVVQVASGFVYKKGSAVEVVVDGFNKFPLFTDGDGAWAATPEADRALVGAMLKGKTLTVSGVPATGAATTDSYSLNGFKPAKDAIDKACK